MNPTCVNSLLLSQVNRTLINLGDEYFFSFLKQKMIEYSIASNKIIEETINSKNIFTVVGKFLEKISEEDFIVILKKAKSHHRIISKEDFENIASKICEHFEITLEECLTNRNNSQKRKDAISVIAHYLIKNKDVEIDHLAKLLFRSRDSVYKYNMRIMYLNERIPEEKELKEKVNAIQLTLQKK